MEDDLVHVDEHVAAAHDLQWLVGFAERDLSSPAARNSAANEVIHFCRRWQHRRFAGGPGVITLLGFDETLEPSELQQIARRCVAYLHRRDDETQGRRRRSWFYFEECAIRFGITWTDGGTLVLSSEGQSATGDFTTAVVSLLEALRDRLRVCAQCGRLFISTRQPQRFCTKRCQNRTTSAEYRARHPKQVSAPRHNRHEAKQKKKLGGAVKVTRRKK